MDSTPVPFTTEELWVLQGSIRHESDQAQTWKFAPTNLELNRQIAGELLSLALTGEKVGQLELSRGDLLAIDFCVSQAARDLDGNAIGRSILLKTFEAWMSLELGIPLTNAEDPDTVMPDDFVMYAKFGVKRPIEETEDAKPDPSP